MSQTIIRMYATPRQASDAAHALRTNRGLRFSDVHIMAPSGPVEPGTDAAGPPLSVEDIAEGLMKTYVLKAHATVLAEGIHRGGTTVTVHAPFGSGGTAVRILDKHGPIDAGIADDADPPMPWDEAAPLSSMLGIPTLLPGSASFSRFWNLPALSGHGQTVGTWLGIPEIRAQHGPYKGVLGATLLSDKPAPLSSAIGLKTLTDKQTPQSSSMGLPLTASNAAPLSSSIGLPVLTKSSLYLSSLIGLPLLMSETKGDRDPS